MIKLRLEKVPKIFDSTAQHEKIYCFVGNVEKQIVIIIGEAISVFESSLSWL